MCVRARRIGAKSPTPVDDRSTFRRGFSTKGGRRYFPEYNRHVKREEKERKRTKEENEDEKEKKTTRQKGDKKKKEKPKQKRKKGKAL